MFPRNYSGNPANSPLCRFLPQIRADCRLMLHHLLQPKLLSTVNGNLMKGYFELKDLEEMTREQVEKFVRQAGGVKSLIDCLHGLTTMLKKDAKHRKQLPVHLNAFSILLTL
ncbi:hypothetical protein KFK09_026435 [Dendrobium nobile]|uniref:Uncharacterized protein n=1 Tax=Dendrobium nobile TaxID=94219 RepID=A0A8T3A7W3_DENNO|nr:hypothetical protein KFK09_026435 [Dendrobium nobile]